MDLHGGNTHKFIREKNMTNILDYSANINPLGIPKSAMDSFSQAVQKLELYPDPEYIDLRNAIAKYNKASTENVIVGNGASELIFLLFKIMSGKKILIISPTFAEYERAAIINKCKVEFFQLKENEQFEVNLNRLDKVLENGYDVCVVCNPNNPTGHQIPFEKMEKIYSICISMATILFVDEAFMEFTTGGLKNSIINTTLEKKHLYVTRAYTKYFGMPGLRLGYALSFNKKISERINAVKEPWSVNTFAEYAGINVLSDKKYMEKTENWIESEKVCFYKGLSEIKNLKAYKPDANFILVKSNTKTAEEIYSEMAEEGIIIRRCSNFKYLDNYFFRLAIKSHNDNIKVLEKLKIIMETGELK